MLPNSCVIVLTTNAYHATPKIWQNMQNSISLGLLAWISPNPTVVNVVNAKYSDAM